MEQCAIHLGEAPEASRPWESSGLASATATRRGRRENGGAVRLGREPCGHGREVHWGRPWSGLFDAGLRCATGCLRGTWCGRCSTRLASWTCRRSTSPNLDPQQFVTRPQGRRAWVREGRRAPDAKRERDARPIAHDRTDRLFDAWTALGGRAGLRARVSSGL